EKEKFVRIFPAGEELSVEDIQNLRKKYFHSYYMNTNCHLGQLFSLKKQNHIYYLLSNLSCTS
ncbi:MAG: hypothetical protein ACK55Z_03650, partial [bacterium]